nr:poly [ADP-ribose] polymerase 2 isoform X2 [Solanum lycopersicum]
MATITNFNVDEFDSMNVVEEYKKISVNDPVNFYTWSKKKFVDRLCAVANLQIDDHLPVGDEGKTEKLVTATKKGAAVLDQYLSDEIKALYHVLHQGNDIYEATLNQTNVENNDNEFYIIQVLGLYEPLKQIQGQSILVPRSRPRETKLEAPIAKFISLICDINMMRQQMMEIGYNANKLPLGKLSKKTILKGYDVLKNIADVIGQFNRTLLEDLSSQFYTVIPHDFGFQKMCEFVIDTLPKLKRKIEMVKALAEIEVTTKLSEDNTDIQEDPLFYQYEQLGCKLVPVEVGSQEYLMIENYMKNTHAKIHSGYAVDIVQVFRASRNGENERFQKFSDTSNRMLLWHGSRLTNWAGILSQGLRIAPPEAPSTGYMFGKGVYFADMFSESAIYCYASSAAKNGVLLLCEVALGDMNELLSANSDADKLPLGKLSTKAVGAMAPDFKEAQILEDGVIVPLGNPKERPKHEGNLLHNEYIVYNVEQLRMRYVIQVEFNYEI